jgi:N-acetylneuraminic acid mutarotase
MPTARGAVAGGVIDGRLYVTGGAVTNQTLDTPPLDVTEVLDLRRGRWTEGPPLPTRRHHSASAALGGRLYVAGGRDPRSSELRTVEALDPRRGAWERLPALPMGASGSEGEAAGRDFVVTGGENAHGLARGEDWVTPGAFAYDPRGRRWRRLPDMGVPRHAHASAVAGGRLWVFLGVPCAGGYGGTRTAESLTL